MVAISKGKALAKTSTLPPCNSIHTENAAKSNNITNDGKHRRDFVKTAEQSNTKN